MFGGRADWTWKRFAVLLGQLSLSASLLYLVGRKTGAWSALPGLVRGTEAGWIAAGLATALASIALGVLRWTVFLEVQGVRPGWRRVVRLATMARFIDLFFFGTAGGDTVKVVALSREHRDRKAAVLLSVLTDRFSGLVALVGLATVCTLTRWDRFAGSPWSRGLFLFFAATLVVSALGLALGSFFSHPALRGRIAARFGRSRMALRAERFLAAWARFCSSWHAALAGVGVSVAIYLTYFATFYCAARALGTSARVSDFLAVLPVVDVVTMMPVSVSGLGVRETVLQELLGQVAGIPGDTAVAISLVGFGFTLFWVVAGGLAVQLGFLKPARLEASTGAGNASGADLPGPGPASMTGRATAADQRAEQARQDE
jgi:uncharacterized protein (TIRG00374 family)